MTPETTRDLRFSETLFWVLLSAVAFHLSYAAAWLGGLTLVYLYGLVQLARAGTWRRALHAGLAAGLIIAAGRLDFFVRIFSWGAAVLWLVFAFWIALFVVLARLCLTRFPVPWSWVCIPFVWCGLEYIRSELYYLKFAWLSPGFAFEAFPWSGVFPHLGVYGIGFVIAVVSCAIASVSQKSRLQGLTATALGAFLLGLPAVWVPEARGGQSSDIIRVAGIQMEFPSEQQVVVGLNNLIRAHPDTDLIVLSEYTFSDVVPAKVMKWCRDHRKYLIAGGKESAENHQFRNTAFVISPEGEVVFRQVKSVPIQFFKDGLPAAVQGVWSSPWGRLGICICYDLSYTRVTDRLVELGAQALIVPTMDVADWGVRQHRLHARVAPVRAAEYGIPVFRVASSGISQLIDARGALLADAPCPGQDAVITGKVEIGSPGTLPLDRWLGPAAAFLTVLGMLLFSGQALLKIWVSRSVLKTLAQVPSPAAGVHS
ncbi:MAG TPA: nitrilase-related carbon-nitrogen hydrolase [Clostridia bacterium]|nr:nitrilase-related carbon-nitrogen hydrolase [Clostridia bacterium]